MNQGRGKTGGTLPAGSGTSKWGGFQIDWNGGGAKIDQVTPVIRKGRRCRAKSGKEVTHQANCAMQSNKVTQIKTGMRMSGKTADDTLESKWG